MLCKYFKWHRLKMDGFLRFRHLCPNKAIRMRCGNIYSYAALQISYSGGCSVSAGLKLVVSILQRLLSHDGCLRENPYHGELHAQDSTTLTSEHREFYAVSRLASLRHSLFSPRCMVTTSPPLHDHDPAKQTTRDKALRISQYKILIQSSMQSVYQKQQKPSSQLSKNARNKAHDLVM